MNTDGYSELFSEEKLNQAVSLTLSHIKEHPEKSISTHIKTTLHEIFCPCLLSYCSGCEHGNCDTTVPFENALIQEINTRLLYTVCKNNCAHALLHTGQPKKSLPIIFRLSSIQKNKITAH